jgi:serine/threonine protein kinase
MDYFKIFLEKISTLPNNVPKEQYHYFVFTNYVFILAFFSHLFLLITFTLLGIPSLVFFNIGSCILFILALAGNFRGYILFSTCLGTLEIVSHAIFCVYILGWNSGFQYYILGLVISFLSAPWQRNKLKITLVVITGVTYISLNYYSQLQQPIKVLEPLLLNAFNIVNLLMFIFVIALSNYASDDAVAKAEAKLDEALEQIKLSKLETEKKNLELDSALETLKVSQQETERKNLELEKKNEELANKNRELSQSYKRANQIFSALSEALPGTVLDGKYQIETRIGSGGFGAVYRAVHLTTKRIVAAKIFQPLAGNATVEGLERFQLEAILACKVHHPNAVEIIDSGISSNGIAYIIMELLNGYPLTNELRRKGRLSAKRCTEIIVPVCDVLAKAHSEGIIHRDIKPDNIFLHQEDGVEIVKVVDFGIAKLQRETQSFDQNSITATGEILGTPTYMSPERLLNKDFDGKADVYSVGIVLYQMLCGETPFKSSDIWTTIRMQVSEDPTPLREINSEVSQEVQAVVLAALKKDPDERPTAKELAQELSIASGIEIRATESGSIKLLNVFVGMTLEEAEKKEKLLEDVTRKITVPLKKDTKAN